MSISRIASDCPPVMVATTRYKRSDAYVSDDGTAPAARSFSIGDNDTVRGKLNENGVVMDAALMFGGGSIRCVAWGLTFTVTGFNQITVIAGQGIADGLVELAADAAGIAVTVGWNYIWLQQGSNGTGTIHVTTTPIPLTTKTIFLGQIQMAAGTGTPDYSGVMYDWGGFRIRQTNDTSAPSDVPPGSIVFLTRTQGGTYLWDGFAWQIATSTSGTVTSVALTMPGIFNETGSPITGAGTIAVTLANQNANKFFGGPGSGADAAPTFRTLVAADIPSLAAGKITSGTFSAAQLPIFLPSGTGHAIGAVPDPGGAAGTTRFLCEDATWKVPTASAGTVTSVGLSMPNIFSVANSPVTGAGTLAVTLANQLSGLFLASPDSGPAGAPVFRAIELSDLPALPVGGLRCELCTIPTPLATGPDGYEFTIPYDPSDGTTSVTWNILRAGLRLGTAASTGSSTAQFEKSNGTGAFSATTIGSVTITATNYENNNTTTLGTVNSGDKVRVNVTAIGTGTANWSAWLELGR